MEQGARERAPGRQKARGGFLAGTHVVGQHGRVRDAGEKIMADTGALRGAAVAGHAGAVVERVGDIQLHVAVSLRVATYRSRMRRYNLSCPESGTPEALGALQVRALRGKRRDTAATDSQRRDCPES